MRPKKAVSYRSTRNVDMEEFKKDVIEKLNELPETTDMLMKIERYNSILTEIVNKHAPMKSKTIKVVHEAPWFDSEYADIRKLRRKAEKKYKKTGLESDRKMYIALRKQAINLSFDKKKAFISSKLGQGTTCRTLYSVVNELIDNKKDTVLPTSQSDKNLADGFQQFFKEKIEKIRSTFNTPDQSDVIQEEVSGIKKLSKFEPTTVDEVLKIVKSFGVKCSPDDPVPATLLASSIETFVPYWVEIVNLSLEIGSMDGMKSAVVLPLIKDLSSATDTEKYKNYRPVSNLVFVSKIIERVVEIRLDEHMVHNDLYMDKNYGYRKDHSTELLMLKVVNDLFESFDKNIPSVVVLLDLSAAFDTVDHKKLLEILKNDIGVEGVALKWFESFLI